MSSRPTLSDSFLSQPYDQGHEIGTACLNDGLQYKKAMAFLRRLAAEALGIPSCFLPWHVREPMEQGLRDAYDR